VSEPTAAELKSRRRSERLYLTIPIRVFGTDPSGRDFCEDTLTTSVNRHGARIRLENSLVVSEEVHITNLTNNREDHFRVVGPVGERPRGAAFGDWGVQCLQPEKNIWGIEFRDSPEEAGEASALLECCSCSSVASVQLSYEEMDALAATKLLSRECSQCRQGTLWKAASPDRRRQEPAAIPNALAAAGLPQQTPVPPPRVEPIGKPAPAEEGRTGQERRQERRLALRVSIRIRAQDGAAEITKTENLSKTGARFLSSICCRSLHARGRTNRDQGYGGRDR